MKNDPIAKKLDSYLKNEGNKADNKRIDDWCDDEAKTTSYSLDKVGGVYFKDKIKSAIDREIGDKKYGLKKMLAMVAAAILVFLSTIFYFSLNPTIDTVKYVSRIASPGKNVILKLGDGTVVTLNAGTEIRYPERFSKNMREVFLVTGEAFFDVAKDPKKPFVVKSGQLRTTVLGTKFNVNYSPFFEDIKVAVSAGKVMVADVSNSNGVTDSLILFPAEQASFSKQGNSLTKSKVDTLRVNSWMRGEFYFDNENLGDIVKHLNARFSKQIILGDSLIGTYKVSLGYKNKDSFDEVLSAIKNANHLTSVVKENKIILFNR